MITIDAFKAYGTRTGSPTQIPLDEITLLASPATLKALGISWCTRHNAWRKTA